MRRFAAVALTAGTLMAGMAAVGAPAEAATGWKPYDAYSNIDAWGTYTRGGTTYVKGTLRDRKRNGWTACVRFLFVEGKNKYWSRHKIIGITSGGTKFNFDGVAKVSISSQSPYSEHLWVQECGRNKETGKYLYGKGRQLF